MSQKTWLKGPVCGIDNCRSRLYQLNAGRKSCQFGHVMEGNLEFEDDEDTYVQTKRLNIHLTDTGFGSQSHASVNHSSSTLTQTKSHRLHGDDGRNYMFKCLQWVLYRLVPLVVDHLYAHIGSEKLANLQRNIMNTAKLLWIRFVKKTLANKTPSVLDLFSLIYLSLRVLNQVPVCFSDYIAMIKNNKVPYLNATVLVPPKMIRLMPLPKSFAMLTPWYIPIDDQFFKNNLRLTRILELSLVWSPSADCFHYQAFRLFLDLRLPQVSSLLVMYHNVVWQVTGGKFPPGFYKTYVGPEVQAACYMFFVLEMYFKFSEEIVDVEEFLAWLFRGDKSKLFLNHFKHDMEVRDLFEFNENEISDYCDWVYETLIPRKHKELDEPEFNINPMDRKAFKLFPYKTGETLGSESGSPRTKLAEHSLTELDSIQDSPFSLVQNTLTKKDLAGVRSKLASYFSIHFGMKVKTLLDNRDRLDLELYRAGKAGKLVQTHKFH